MWRKQFLSGRKRTVATKVITEILLLITWYRLVWGIGEHRVLAKQLHHYLYTLIGGEIEHLLLLIVLYPYQNRLRIVPAHIRNIMLSF